MSSCLPPLPLATLSSFPRLGPKALGASGQWERLSLQVAALEVLLEFDEPDFSLLNELFGLGVDRTQGKAIIEY